MIKGKCKKCGKTLQIDDELIAFSCMYCGAKLRPSDLLVTDCDSDPQEARRHLQFALDNILSCVIDQRGIMAHFNRNEYASSFSKYRIACFRVFDELNSAVILDPPRREEFISAATDKLITGLETDWQKNPNWSKKKVRNEIIDKDKMVIAIYLVPMVDKLGLSISDYFNNALQKAWVEKYPKNIFYVGSYDKITGAYDAKLKLCYITTAVSRADGKPDNCYELEALRSFRDNWLVFSPGGAELIKEYYRIAPAIVCCMELTGGDYEELNREYIMPCIDYIEAGDMVSCRERYVDMVNNLKNRYLV